MRQIILAVLAFALSFHPALAASAASPFPTLGWASQPTAQDIFALALFPEPLVPVGREPTLEDNRVLLDALKRHSQRKTIEDVSILTGWLVEHPDNPWRVALLTNLGIGYYKNGYFSSALDAWEQAWREGRAEQSPRGKAIVDRAVGELVRMHARIGHVERLKELFKELEGRTLAGSASEYLSTAKQGLWMMENEPGVSFLCGPMALRNVFKAIQPEGADIAPIEQARSGKQGFSLQQVQDLADAAKLHYRLAKRAPGAPLPLPAVAHWKVSHYAALVGEQNGLYHLKDPTFGDDLWISKAALEHETSGYYLIADNGPLPEGWEPVGAEEAKTIHGMGNTGDNDGPGPGDKTQGGGGGGGDGGGDGGGCNACPCPGMAHYNFSSMAASLNVMDMPLRYKPAVGPSVAFTVSYSQREIGQPANFNFSNLGPKWTHNWLAYIVDTPSNLAANVATHPPGGGIETNVNYNADTRRFDVQRDSKTLLTRTQDTPPIYRRQFPDGSAEIYAQAAAVTADGSRQVFLSKLVDAQGNAVTLAYDSKPRLVSLTDAAGKVTKLSYTDPVDLYKITQVADPFGRAALFAYQYLDATGKTCDPKKQTGCVADKLASSTDTAGMVSSFKYAAGGDFLNTLTTPYGTTAFNFGEDNNNGPHRWLLATDPLGNKERLEFMHNAPGIDGSENAVPAGMSITNNYLQYRNSFYWDKRATAQACTFNGTVATCDYTKAHIDHWMHGSGDKFWTTTAVLESEKEPLENRVWYNYAGQPLSYQPGPLNKPSLVGRILDDGSTQLSQYAYNGLSRLTQAVDATGRTVFMEYDPANQIDLLKVWRKTAASCDIPNNVKTGCDLQVTYTYNAQHLPLTYIDAAGQKTQYAYNKWGQPTTITNALNQVVTLSYIETATDPNYRRLSKIARAGQALASYTYDSAGRVRTTTDAGGYALVYDYDKLDRLLKTTYPDKTFEQQTYDKLNVGTKTDRQGRVTTFKHNAIGQLNQTIYPKNPGDPDRIVKLDWCACGALNSLTDAKGQTTRWSRDLQKRVTGKYYPNNSGTTPDEAYVYAPGTSRLQSVFNQRQIDAGGQVLSEQRTDYGYALDDRIQSIVYDAGNLNDTPTPGVSFAYDPWYPRLASLSDGIGQTHYSYYSAGDIGAGQLSQEDGPWANDTLQYTYDKLGRLATRQINGQGKLSLAYDALARPSSMTNPLGAFSYAYLGATGQVTDITTQITSTKPGPHTHFDYWDNTRDRRLKHLEQTVGPAPQRLLSAYDYGYNPMGQITRWTQQPYGQPTLAANYRYDAIDELTGVDPLNAAAGSAYAYAYDLAGNRNTETVDGVAVTETSNNLNQLLQRGAASYSYDAAGNQTFDSGAGQSYRWDGANRLVSVVNASDPGAHSDFAYDGLGRRRVIQEYQGGALISEKHYVWCGLSLCEERDGSNAVTKRYFDQGETRGTAQYYYARDHLGSIRELTDASGKVRAQYSYDPWGRRTKLDGDLDSDFGYTGHYYHAASGLHLAPYREYGAEVGRWIKRDIIRERGGLNLYAYTHNSPVNYKDLLGLNGSQCSGSDTEDSGGSSSGSNSGDSGSSSSDSGDSGSSNSDYPPTIYTPPNPLSGAPGSMDNP